MQQNPMIPIIQECIDATTEHQRLRALMKGEWAKGLLPQSSVRADYTVQRIRGSYISHILHPYLVVWTFHNCYLTLYPFQGPVNLPFGLFICLTILIRVSSGATIWVVYLPNHPVFKSSQNLLKEPA